MQDLYAAVQNIERRLAKVEDATAANAEAVQAAGVATLDAVDFASDEAAEAALDAGLTAAHFVNRSPSGKTGYTKADAREAAEEANGGDGAE